MDEFVVLQVTHNPKAFARLRGAQEALRAAGIEFRLHRVKTVTQIRVPQHVHKQAMTTVGPFKGRQK